MMSKKEFLSLHDWLKLQGGLTEEEVKAFEEKAKAKAQQRLHLSANCVPEGSRSDEVGHFN